MGKGLPITFRFPEVLKHPEKYLTGLLNFQALKNGEYLVRTA